MIIIFNLFVFCVFSCFVSFGVFFSSPCLHVPK